MKAFTLVALLSSALPLYGDTPLLRRTVATYTLLKQETKTPAAVNLFIKKYLRYIPDEAGEYTNYLGQKKQVYNDYMYNPVDTYLRGGGDCEDYAALAVDWLRFHGHEAKIIACYHKNKKGGHALCVVKENGNWSYIDNGGYRSKYQTIDKLVKDACEDVRRYCDIVPDSTQLTGYKEINHVIVLRSGGSVTLFREK